METNLFILAIFGLAVIAALSRWLFVMLRGKAPDHMVLALFAEAQRELITNTAQAEFHKSQATMYLKRIDRLRPEINAIEAKRRASKVHYRGGQVPPQPMPPEMRQSKDLCGND